MATVCLLLLVVVANAVLFVSLLFDQFLCVVFLLRSCFSRNIIKSTDPQRVERAGDDPKQRQA